MTHDLDEIERRLEAWRQRRREEAQAWAEHRREQPTRRRGRPSNPTRSRLRQRTFDHYKAQALASGCTPLREARLRAGLTMAEAAEAVGLGWSLMKVQRAESADQPNADVERRLRAVYEKASA